MTRAYLYLLVIACSGSTPPDVSPPEADTDTDSDTDADSDADADTDSDTDTDTDSDADTDSDTDADPCAVPACTVGTGVEAFTELVQGGPIQLTHGPQGGWHVDMAVRATGTDAVLRILPQVTRTDTAVTLAGSEGAADQINLALSNTATCTHEGSQIQAVFDDIDVDLAYICALEGVELELTVDFQELTGASATGSCTQTGYAVLDPLDVDLCASL